MKKAVLISCFDWYSARLKPIRELLIEKKYDVTVLESDFDHINKKIISQTHPGCTYIHVPKYKSNLSISRVYSHLYFGRIVRRKLEQLKPDLIYCLVPPNNVARHCRAYKRTHPATKLIIDIIDLWPESMPLGKLRGTLPAKMWKKWRDDSIRVADHVFTECDLYQGKLERVLNSGKTSTLHLYKEQTTKEAALVDEIIKNQATNEHKTVKLAYLGSMNNIIDIDGICGVIKRFLDSGRKCELHAIGDGTGRVRFEQAVRATGCETIFYGSMFDETEKIRILAPCDYAFNMMKGDVAVGLTIKSMDYLSYGLPLINSIRGDTWNIVAKNRLGVNVEDGANWINTMDHESIRGYFQGHFSVESFRQTAESALRDAGIL